MVYATPTLGGTMKVKTIIHDDGIMPVFSTENAACADLATPMSIMLEPFKSYKIPLNISFEFPKGYHAKIYPRSSLLVNYGVASPVSVIDEDYRGIIHVVLQNTTDNNVVFTRGDRLCQIEIVKTGPRPRSWLVKKQARCQKGFGGTGLN